MVNTTINEHLRAALEKSIAQEKELLQAVYDKSDTDIANGIEKMRPLISAIKALKLEIGDVEGVEIRPAQHGHMATVSLRSPSLDLSYSISTSLGNQSFELEKRSYYKFGDYDSFDERHTFQDADQALAIVVEAVGKHIAQQQVLSERKK